MTNHRDPQLRPKRMREYTRGYYVIRKDSRMDTLDDYHVALGESHVHSGTYAECIAWVNARLPNDKLNTWRREQPSC